MAELANKYPRSSALYIVLTCVEYRELNNKYTAMYNLRKTEEVVPSLTEQVEVSYIFFLLECKMQKKKSKISLKNNDQTNSIKHQKLKIHITQILKLYHSV